MDLNKPSISRWTVNKTLTPRQFFSASVSSTQERTMNTTRFCETCLLVSFLKKVNHRRPCQWTQNHFVISLWLYCNKTIQYRKVHSVRTTTVTSKLGTVRYNMNVQSFQPLQLVVGDIKYLITITRILFPYQFKYPSVVLRKMTLFCYFTIIFSLEDSSVIAVTSTCIYFKLASHKVEYVPSTYYNSSTLVVPPN